MPPTRGRRFVGSDRRFWLGNLPIEAAMMCPRSYRQDCGVVRTVIPLLCRRMGWFEEALATLAPILADRPKIPLAQVRSDLVSKTFPWEPRKRRKAAIDSVAPG